VYERGKASARRRCATDFSLVRSVDDDEVGHVFGARRGREMKEILISADGSLAGFIDMLDKEIGRGPCWL
jgi:hypothetical protein